jgi:4-aminobutyrate aminotransferase-like enzyme
MLTKITPGDFKKRVAFGLSGSDANDGMIKLARCYTGRSKIISFIQFEIALKYYMPAEEIAAVIMEPIAGDAGLVVPPQRYMKRLYEICKANDILFVSEEVQQGFGRTGKWFGIDLVKDRDTNERDGVAAAKICYRCWEKGVILTFFANNVLRVQPPLVITKDDMDRAIDIIDESIQDYLSGDISDEVLGIAKGW